MKLLILIIVGLLIAVSAYAQQTQTLRVGAQSIPLFLDKKSSPVLAVQMPEGDIWYGFLTSGTAPGRLTVQMPSGDIFSLFPPPDWCPPGFFCSTIWDDYPEVYTADPEFMAVNPHYNDGNVHISTVSEANIAALLDAGIWPTYQVQAMCSDTNVGSWQVGEPVHSSTGLVCWCRLKRRYDGANGVWVQRYVNSSLSNCRTLCPSNCVGHAHGSSFRNIMLSSFANP